MLENEARLFPDADSDAMPHFKQTMFPFVNLANQQTASAAGWQTCSRRLSNNQIF